MNLPVWTESRICERGGACVNCRSDQAESWWERWSRQYALPDEWKARDGETQDQTNARRQATCPKKLPMGWTPAKASPAPPPKPVTVAVPARKALAAVRTVVANRMGIGVADDATIASRTAICEACPHLKRIKAKVGRVGVPTEYTGCEKCGCQYRSKVRSARESCPVGKWGPSPKPAA